MIQKKGRKQAHVTVIVSCEVSVHTCVTCVMVTHSPLYTHSQSQVLIYTRTHSLLLTIEVKLEKKETKKLIIPSLFVINIKIKQTIEAHKASMSEMFSSQVCKLPAMFPSGSTLKVLLAETDIRTVSDLLPRFGVQSS